MEPKFQNKKMGPRFRLGAGKPWIVTIIPYNMSFKKIIFWFNLFQTCSNLLVADWVTKFTFPLITYFSTIEIAYIHCMERGRLLDRKKEKNW